MGKNIPYTVADNSSEWMPAKPTDIDLYDDSSGGDMSFSSLMGKKKKMKSSNMSGRMKKRIRNKMLVDPTIDTYLENAPSQPRSQDGMPNEMENPEFSNAGGYGFWVSKDAAAQKAAAGIPPLGGFKAAKQANEAAAISALNQPDSPDTAAALAALNAPAPASGAGKGGAKTPKADNTMLYVGIGAGVLVIGGVAIYFLRKKK